MHTYQMKLACYTNLQYIFSNYFAHMTLSYSEKSQHFSPCGATKLLLKLYSCISFYTHIPLPVCLHPCTFQSDMVALKRQKQDDFHRVGLIYTRISPARAIYSTPKRKKTTTCYVTKSVLELLALAILLSQSPKQLILHTCATPSS